MKTEWLIVGGIVVVLILVGAYFLLKKSSGGGGGPTPPPAPPSGVRLTTGGAQGYTYTLEWDASATGTPPITYGWDIYPANSAQNPVGSGTTQ